MAKTTTFRKGGVTAKLTVTDKDKGYKRIKKELKKLNKSYTLVGYPGETSSDLKTIVATMEFGSIKNKIPSRPFNRQTFDSSETQKELAKLIDSFLGRIYSGKISVKRALAQLGEYYVGRIKYTIMNGVFAPLKMATIRRKGSSRPLVDTGRMKNSVTHKEVFK